MSSANPTTEEIESNKTRTSEDVVSGSSSKANSPLESSAPSPTRPDPGSTLAKQPPCGAVAATGVPQPIQELHESYMSAMNSGSPEDAARVAFLDGFNDPASPLTPHVDDMCWMVTPNTEDGVTLVRRSQLRSKFDADPHFQSSVRWQDTLALNLVTQWTYTLTVAVAQVVQINGKSQLVAIRKKVKQVYGSPAKSMFRNTKDGMQEDTIDYPNIYFNVHDFEDTFGDIRLTQEHGIAVMLTAGDTVNSNAVIFRGFLLYEALMQRVMKKFAVSKVAPTQNQREFIPLIGPNKLGKTEIAVCIGDADLMVSQSLTEPGGSRDSPSGHAANAQASNGFFSRGSNSIFDKVTSKLAGKPQYEICGDEMLQCCLTHVSVNVNHILMLLQSKDPQRPQWLHLPDSSDELLKILEDHRERMMEKQSAAANGSFSGSTKMSPASSRESSVNPSFGGNAQTAANSARARSDSQKKNTTTSSEGGNSEQSEKKSGGFFSNIRQKWSGKK